MSRNRFAQLKLAICLAAVHAMSLAHSPGTSGPANPKEVGKPGTPANTGATTDGALNSADAKA